MPPPSQTQRDSLRRASKETREALPKILSVLSTKHPATSSKKYSFSTVDRSWPLARPRHDSPATIKVVNQDTLNAAIDMRTLIRNSRYYDDIPLILNFANAHSPGGGWLKGAMEQEEAICYRSSLSLSLNRR